MSGKALAAVEKRNGTAASALPLTFTKQCQDVAAANWVVAFQLRFSLRGTRTVIGLGAMRTSSICMLYHGQVRTNA
ncbi:hypothetical protein MFFC18_28090 [Mariniblastus fucicola]|uniref:Uncharacterized protein n=1 Tax=Mariniblastus fucicola TaxID=980251 RepID=A0A5B9PJT7_9BACT|nr:hypothetical protein MFFC18_28090 [Mariniblastus fucicola]